MIRGRVRSAFQQGTLLNLTSPEYKSIYNAVSVKPSNKVALAQNAFVKTLVDGGQWAKFACIIPYGWGMPSASDSLFWVNNIARKAVLSATAPTYVAGIGFTGNGTSSYINSTFNPVADGGTLYTRNDASAAWLFTNDRRTAEISGSGLANGDNGSLIMPVYAVNTCYFRINNAYQPLTGGNLTTDNLFTLVRKSSTICNVYRGRVPLGSDVTKASTALDNDVSYTLAIKTLGGGVQAGSYQTDTVGLEFHGSLLSQSDINAICDAWDELQLKIHSDIYLSDSCSGHSIDLTKWDILNNTSASFSQNNALEVDALLTPDASFWNNQATTDLYKSHGVFKFSSLQMPYTNVTSNAIKCGIKDSSNANRVEIYRKPGNAFLNLAFVVANSIISEVSNIGYDLNDLKIIVTPTLAVRAYKWNGTSWVQLGAQQNMEMRNNKIFIATVGGLLLKGSISDVQITNYDFTTYNPS